MEWRVVVSPDGTAYWKDTSTRRSPVGGGGGDGEGEEPEPDNWVWSPQGEVAMHLPERWGMLQFAAGAVNATPATYNRQWTVRAVAAAVYYAQRAWFDGPGEGTFTDNVAARVVSVLHHTHYSQCTYLIRVCVEA